ncbi:anti-sigma factor domain-containing protein [Lysobacter koreensis]|uniref:Anti-sigma factor domain-containing protein n=1 Tax=Lysobacter koreensis TaxID=266122 RepID=A0ABW2YJB4_9GAMM
MSDEQFQHEPPSDDLLAAEYVVGVLDAAARRAAQARIDGEPAFAALVLAWEQRFAALLDGIDPVTVPEQVWLRLRARLGWSPVEGGKRGAWQSVGFWRAATAVAAAAAIGAVVIGRIPQAPVPAPQPPQVVVQPAPTPAPEEAAAKPVTTLAHDDGTPGWLASIDLARGSVLMVPVPAAADAQGRVPELWLIPAGEAPRSLGLVSIDKAHSVSVPADIRRALAVGSTLAITLEPQGGAPQGVPTGPIIAKGGIQII